jgi:hypothetical protein
MCFHHYNQWYEKNRRADPTIIKHGHARKGQVSPEWKIWQRMKTRCFNPTALDYSRYGGRGITVCDRWMESFENFLADMGLRPSSEHSIDRINNEGNYEPLNCRWATVIEQSNNKRSNRILVLNGEHLNMTQWSQRLDIKVSTIKTRLGLGWSDERTLTEPIRRKHQYSLEVAK